MALVPALVPPAMAFPFPSFVQALEQQHGAAALAVRHELFFQTQKPFAVGRAWAAVARDYALLRQSVPSNSRAEGEAVPEGAPVAVLLATLGGSSGWGTLARALPVVREAGLAPVILAHPRLARSLFPADVPVVRPAWGKNGQREELSLLRAHPLVLAACLRHRFWRSALQETLAGRRGVILLHNDFDMMSAASLTLGWPTVCLQHGIPTDEFFPCRADHMAVWGESSARAFQAGGLSPHAIVTDALGRDSALSEPPSAPPCAVAVVSQSHAAIFGPALPAALTVFVADLCAKMSNVVVLLHPAENGKHPYRSVPVSLPPHALLQDAHTPSLVVAYCSTMALDAAAAGHWVATLEGPYSGNEAARAVASAPLRVQTAQDAKMLYDRLCHDTAFRLHAAQRQQAWMATTFSTQTGGLLGLLQAIVPPCP